MIPKDFEVCGTVFEDTFPASAPAFHTGSGMGFGDPVSALRASVFRGSFEAKLRFHDEMQAAIRTDQEGKIFPRAGMGGLGHIQNLLRMLQEYVH